MTDITRWKPQVETALRKYSRHYPRSEREDLSQELYLHLLRQEKYLLRIQDKTWQRKTVCILLRNRIFDFSRKFYRREPPVPLEDAEEFTNYGGDLNFEEMVEGITPTESLVLEVLFRTGETQEAAAEALGRTRGWVMQVKKLALDKIRRHM